MKFHGGKGSSPIKKHYAYRNSENFQIFKFYSELIFVGGITRQYTMHYKFKFSGKSIFVEGTTYEN